MSSTTTTIIGAFGNFCITAIPGLKVLQGPIDTENLRKQDLPHLQFRNPNRVTVGEGLFRQQQHEFSFTCVLVVERQTQEQLLTLIDDIETQLLVEPHLLLAAIGVLWSKINSFAVSDVPINEHGWQAITFEALIEYIV